MKALLTIREVAARVRVSVRAARDLPLDRIRMGPRTVRYDPEQLDQLLQERRLHRRRASACPLAVREPAADVLSRLPAWIREALE